MSKLLMFFDVTCEDKKAAPELAGHTAYTVCHCSCLVYWAAVNDGVVFQSVLFLCPVRGDYLLCSFRVHIQTVAHSWLLHGENYSKLPGKARKI
jgi:hypothetical protein